MSTAKKPAAKRATKAKAAKKSATQAIRAAFGNRPRLIDDVLKTLAAEGYKLTEKQLRAGLDRIRAAGAKVKCTGTRTFSIS